MINYPTGVPAASRRRGAAKPDKPDKPGKAGKAGPRLVRRRGRWLMSLVAVTSLAAVGLVASPSYATDIICDQDIHDGTFGNVQVPAGEFCGLTNVVVVGQVTVGAGADLFLTQTSVAGGLTASTDAFIDALDSGLFSGVTLNDVFALSARGSIIAGGVEVTGHASKLTPALVSQGSIHAGGITSRNGWTLVRDGRVNGDLDTDGDRETDLYRTDVAGSISIRAADRGTMLCQVTTHDGPASRTAGVDAAGVDTAGVDAAGVDAAAPVPGSIEVRDIDNASAMVQIGGPFRPGLVRPDCPGNNIDGPVDVHDNTAGSIQISSNTIVGNIGCTGNTPAPVGFGNLIFGTASGQCVTLGTVQGKIIPDPGDPGEKEAATEADRVVDILDLVETRRAAAG